MIFEKLERTDRHVTVPVFVYDEKDGMDICGSGSYSVGNHGNLGERFK